MSDLDESPLDYELPVAELLEVGDDGLQWDDPFDYSEEFELSAADIPELLRMAADERLNKASFESLRVWAPIHAIRALAQLRAAEAVEPLLNLIVRNRHDENATHDEWLHSEVPNALIEIGSPAVGPTVRLIMDPSRDQYSRAVAAKVLSKLGRQDLDLYPQCVAALAAALENFRDNEPELNAFIIGYLLNLDAEETCPLIEQAFAAGAVDETVVGDWEDVLVDFGRLPPLSEAASREKMYRRFPFTRILEPLRDQASELLRPQITGARSGEKHVEGLDEAEGFLKAPPEPEQQFRMTMPEDLYTADERRRLAKQRNKQRKAAKRTKQPGAQAKHRD